MKAFTVFTTTVFVTLIIVLAICIAPALLIWSFNTLNEQGQWGLGYMPHNIWTYVSIIVITMLTKVSVRTK